MNTSADKNMRKLLVAVIIEVIVLALALWLHMVIDYAVWCQMECSALWNWRESILNGQLWMAVAQYVAITTAFLMAWLVWHWPGHKLSYILLAWGMTWLPVAFVCTSDCARMPHGPMNMPLSLFAFPFFALFCVLEAVVIGCVVKLPSKSQ